MRDDEVSRGSSASDSASASSRGHAPGPLQIRLPDDAEAELLGSSPFQRAAEETEAPPALGCWMRMWKQALVSLSFLFCGLDAVPLPADLSPCS